MQGKLLNTRFAIVANITIKSSVIESELGMEVPY